MKLRYDSSVDAAYIYIEGDIKPGGAAKTYVCDPDEVNGHIHLDFDAEGRLLGIEVLDASKRLPRSVVSEQRSGETATDYFKLWIDGLLKTPAQPLRSTIMVEGRRREVLGATGQFAIVTVAIEPAQSFEVVDEVPKSAELSALGYPDWAMIGLLDILGPSDDLSLSQCRIVLKDVRYHELDSSPMAFREAGRDAGRKVLAALQQV
jgi:uncharacterized protein YuzE